MVHRSLTPHSVRLLGKTILSVLMICCLTDFACSDGKSIPAYDVALRRLDSIPPGTVIVKEAPKDWSHLIVKSYSRPAEGDVNQLSAMADRMARLLFTAIVANVKEENGGGEGKSYKLEKVAVGLGTRIDGKDTIVTPDTQRRLGADLGLLGRVVLRTAQEKIGEIRVVARSASMMVFDSPSFLVVEGKHKPIVFRYVLLVDRKTGRLNALVCALGREGEDYQGPIGRIQCLPPNLTGDCVLHVDGNEFSLGQPTEKAFAAVSPPKGEKEIDAGDELRPLVSRSRFSAASAAELESNLRKILRR
jgi:hypothetical protein